MRAISPDNWKATPNMTEHERDELAEAIAGRIHADGCPLGWKAEDAATLSAFADTLRQIKSAIVIGVASGVMLVLGGLLGSGVWLYVHRAAASPPPTAMVAPADGMPAN